MRSFLVALVLAFVAPVRLFAQDRAEIRYEVAAGDTLWEIAHRFDVPVSTIRSANALRTDALQPGRTLRIPGARAAAPQQRPLGRYTIEDGDTFTSIAARHGVGAHALVRVNPGIDERELRAGMEIALPADARAPAGRPEPRARPLGKAQRRWVSRAERLGLGTTRAASALLAGALEPAWIRLAGPGRPPRTFRWPIRRGWFVRGFGSGTHGGHLAIDIMGDMGWDVLAADRGVVAYAGSAISGYGNLVLLLHPGGWVTAYGHNSSMSVVAGQPVRRGERIARVGATGRARGPHVHFMWITNGGEYCDPLPLFRPWGLHRDGRHVTVDRLRAEHGIPRAIRCRTRPARIDDGEEDDLGAEPEQPEPTAATTPQAADGEAHD
ncbi:MAG: LysM peptidoglycan-binding domain-containing protein [Deltaproteobacteria bacterium]|nr:LysM peptidoglycan-binding domain-containing protein [Deltaproteobacteria bacterium]